MKREGEGEGREGRGGRGGRGRGWREQRKGAENETREGVKGNTYKHICWRLSSGPSLLN